MTSLSSSAASLVSLPARVAAPSVNAPGVQSLSQFTDELRNKVDARAKDDAPAGDERQDDADGGKSLPEKDSDTLDPTLAWLFGQAPLLAPKPATIALPVAPVAPAALDPATLLAAALPAAMPPVAATPLPAVAPDAQPTPDILTPEPALPAPPVDLAKAAAKPALAPAKIPLAVTLQPIADTLGAGTPMPALFALAMNADTKPNDDKSIPSLSTTAATLLQPADAAALIAKAGGAQGQALDMGRQDWPQKMIDHIEALRDGANANDTSISLKPEALGRVDIALRTHTDGAISVRFTAEQPTTRTLLADATPQLSAAADARGIRLAGTSVDLSGSGANDDRQRAQAARSQNITNTLADSGEDTDAVSDGRIA